MSVLNLIRSDLLDFNAYSTAKDEAQVGNIWLNANESPFDLDANNKINRYPEKQAKKLITLFANLFNVANDQILLSRGSDEAIDLLVRLFCSQGKDAILICPPTYGMYAVCARLQGAKIIEVPLLKENNYQINVPKMIDSWQENIKLIFLCSPNNPTGNVLKKIDILNLCEQMRNKSMVVVDEAYIEFSEEESLSNYINQYDNLVILRTLSKAYGFAGARFGFLLSNSVLLQCLLKIIPPYPLATPIINLVADTFTPNRLLEIKNQIQLIKNEKNKMIKELKSLSFVKNVWPSDANFLLMEVQDSEKIMKLCLTQGIVLRSMFDKLGLANGIRISIGLPDENKKLLNILKEGQ